MSQVNARLWEIVETAARAVTDADTGHYKQESFRAELVERLSSYDAPAHVQELVRDLAVKRLVDGFDARRKPKFSEQGSLYSDGYILKLGHGERVWMLMATPTDLISWAAQESKNSAAVLAAAGRRQAYVALRLSVWAEHPDWRLGRIERDMFDYVVEEEPDYPEPEDDS